MGAIGLNCAIMANRISRRAFGKHAALGVASLAVPISMGQTPTTEDKPKVTDEDLAKIEAQLAKPLSEEAKKLLKGAVEGSRKNGATRMKTKLADISSPGFVTPTYPAERRKH